MKDLGRFKERYDYSFDSRQLGLVLFGVTAVIGLVFILGISVGIQWQRRQPAGVAQAETPAPTANNGLAVQSSVTAQVPVLPAVPVAPPVISPVTAPAPRMNPPAIAAPVDKKPGVREISLAEKSAKPKDDLTFPKALTSKAKEPVPLTPEKKKPQADTGKYSIQIGAFATRKDADDRAEKLRKKGYDTHVYEVPGKKGGYNFKVHIGTFESKDAAAPLVKKLSSSDKGPAPFISKED